MEYYRAQLEKAVYKENAFTNVLKTAEEKTGVNRMHIVYGLIAVVVLWLIFGYGAQFLANFIGFIYPAYCSIKAIESSDKSDDTKWLTYWVVYAFFSLLEFFTDIFLWWIPLYAFLKCIFLVYCMAPTSWNGSQMIYYKVIAPFILKHQSQIDATGARVADIVGDFAESAEKEINSAIKDNAYSRLD